jgi:hypothetical protein
MNNNNLDLIRNLSNKIKNESTSILPKLIVIFDVNYLFNKSVHALSNGVGANHFNTDGDKICKSESDRGVLIRKVVTDMSYALKNISSNSHHEFPVILARDDRSWRKKEIDNYKGNRVKSQDSPIDWDGFYKAIDDFGSIAETRGYIHIKAEEAEADDVISIASKVLNLSGINVIVISADADFNQITHTPKSLDSNLGFTVIFNNNSKSLKITAANGFFDLMQSGIHEKNTSIGLNTLSSEYVDSLISINDFLKEYKTISSDEKVNNPERIKSNLIDSLITIKNFAKKFNPSLPLNEVNPTLEEYTKIIIGDSGDNVSSLYSWKVNTRNFSITPKMSTKILEEYKKYLYENLSENNLDDEYIIEKYIKNSSILLEKFHSIIESNIHENAEKLQFLEFVSKFELSKRLVSLSTENLPERIVSRTLTILEDYFNHKNNFIEPYGQLNKESFLRGTKYYDENLNKSSTRIDSNISIKDKLKPSREVPKFSENEIKKDFSEDVENLLNNILL